MSYSYDVAEDIVDNKRRTIRSEELAELMRRRFEADKARWEEAVANREAQRKAYAKTVAKHLRKVARQLETEGLPEGRMYKFDEVFDEYAAADVNLSVYLPHMPKKPESVDKAIEYVLKGPKTTTITYQQWKALTAGLNDA